jgi:hypothetical protein
LARFGKTIYIVGVEKTIWPYLDGVWISASIAGIYENVFTPSLAAVVAKHQAPLPPMSIIFLHTVGAGYHSVAEEQ